MRNILNVVTDILILLCVAIAGVGHMLPWFRGDQSRMQFQMPRLEAKDGKIDIQQELQRRRDEALRNQDMEVMSFQAWHALRSAIALGALTLLAALSLVVNWGAVARRILVLAMFAAALTAILFMTLSLTHYPITEWHRQFAGQLWLQAGFALALAPTCVAAGLCLARMIWTMPPVRKQNKETLIVPEAVPADSAPPRYPHEPERHPPAAFAPRQP